MDNIDLEKYSVRTDLAFEALDLNRLEHFNEVVNQEYKENNVILKRTIISENVAKEIGKKPGVYYCLDTEAIKSHDHDSLLECENVLTVIIKEVLKLEGITKKDRGLVVGLGNINVTPDSLGPLVIDNVIVTRHMFLINPENIDEGISEVSAIAPGVMGTTGIETFDIIDAVIKKINVDYLIVVDALASRSIARVNKTIQVTNTGISPGSGVGNKRKELSKETIGLPVIAIGVPTVVDAVTIASDTIDYLLKYFNVKINNKENKLVVNNEINYNNEEYPEESKRKEILGEVGVLETNDKIQLLHEVLSPNGYNMMVTPKEVDMDIEDLTKIISGAIDRSLHTIVEHI